MSVTIRVGGVEARIQDGVWSCEDGPTLHLLQALQDPYGPGGEDPYPDLTTAQSAIDRVGGEIVQADEPGTGPKDLVL